MNLRYSVDGCPQVVTSGWLLRYDLMSTNR
nr:MAG TPA: hypothetical protein [Caudoviricetes sp.]